MKWNDLIRFALKTIEEYCPNILVEEDDRAHVCRDTEREDRDAKAIHREWRNAVRIEDHQHRIGKTT